MAKPWSEVEASAGYLSLSPSEQMRAKRQYASQVIGQKPEYKALAPEEKREALRQFLGIEKPQISTGDDVAASVVSGVSASLPAQVGFAITNPVRRLFGQQPVNPADLAYEPQTTQGKTAGLAANVGMEILLPGGSAVKGAKAGLSVAKTALSAGKAGAAAGAVRSALTDTNQGKVPDLANVAKSAAIEGGLSAVGGAVLAKGTNVLGSRLAKAAPEAPTPANIESVKALSENEAQGLVADIIDLDPPRPNLANRAKTVGANILRSEAGALGNQSGKFADGSIHPIDDVNEFFKIHVAPVEKGALVPNSRFEIGSLPESKLAEAAKHVPEFANTENKVRITGRAVKHLHESRPDKAEDILREVREIVLDPQTVNQNLVDPKDPEHAKKMTRALLIRPISEKDNYVSAIEVAKGKDGIDVVSIHLMPTRTLNSKRKRFEPEGQRPHNGDSPHLQEPEAPDPVAGFPDSRSDTSTIPGSVSDVQPSDGQAGFINFGRTPLNPATPEGQVEARISIDKSKPLIDKAAEVVKDARSNLLDDLAPIQKAEAAMGGDGAIYEGARLTRGAAGKVQQILDTGAVDYNTLKPVSKGFGQILDDVRKVGGQRGLDNFRAYSVARRARELEKQGRATGVDLQSANDTIRKFHKQYGQAFKDLKQFQDGVLRYALDSGTLSPEAYDAIRKANRAYVPFRRDVDEKAFSGGGRKFVNLQSGIKTLEGSDLKIVDPFESIIKNTHDIVAAADKNAVGQALVKLAAKDPTSALIKPAKIPMQVTGVTVQEVEQELGIKIPAHLANEIIQVFRPKTNPLPEGVVRVLIDGKPKLFEVDEDLYKGLTGLTREQVPLYVKFFSFPASTLRAGATLSPEFMASNPARDTFTAFLQSKYGFVPVVDTMRGLFHAIGKTDLYKQWRLSGGDNAMLTTMDRGDVQKELATILQHPAERAARNILNPIAALRVLSELSEKATRLGDFAKGVKAEGATKEGLQKAAFQSREVTLDFARMGNQMQNFNRMTAFLNARVQGWDKLARQLSDPKTAKKAWMAGIGGLTLPSLGLLAVNMQDERWAGIPDWEKVAFWHVLVPGGPVLRVPKPPGYGTVFITPFERTLEWAVRKDPKALMEIAKAFGQELPALVPTAITPALEAKADYSFFRRGQITPPGKEKLEPRYQFSEQNTETAKAIGDATNLSPAIIENTVGGYAGGLGIRGLQVLDRLSGRKPLEAPPVEQAPVLKAFVSGVERGSDQRINDFWEAHRGAETKFKTFEMLAKEQPEKAQAYFVKNQAAIASYQVTKEFANALGDLRKAKDATARDKSMPMTEKRAALKDLQRQMGELSQQAKMAVEQVQRQAQQ